MLTKQERRETPRPKDDSARVTIVFTGKSRAKQSMAAECDINNIMAKFQKTATLTHGNLAVPEYGYAPSADFRESMETIKQGEALFAGFPSSIRKKFDNSPEKFLAFVQDEKNNEEMYELGLKIRPSESTEPATPPAAKNEPTSEPKTSTTPVESE